MKLRLDFSETADKAATRAALTTLIGVFEAALRMLSPFMPFLTEEIWHAIYDGAPTEEVDRAGAVSEAAGGLPGRSCRARDGSDAGADRARCARLRKDVGVEEKAAVPIRFARRKAKRSVFEESREIVERMAKVTRI